MSIHVSVNIGYDDIYSDYQTVNIAQLIAGIPTVDALILVSHYTAMVHTREKDTALQANIVRQWYGRFPIAVRQKIDASINRLNSTGHSSFNFINNVSSALLTEYLLANNNHQYVKALTPQQEENLFKVYIYFSSQWTHQQLTFQNLHADFTAPDFMIPFMIRYNDIFEFKDFRLQFIKAMYFFKFCEGNAEFNTYLQVFLNDRGFATWHEYLVNILSVYVECLQPGSIKSVLTFPANEMPVKNTLVEYFINNHAVQTDPDFKDLRTMPLYELQNDEILFFNHNFFIDKLYHSIIFDFGNSLVRGKATYNNRAITTLPQFMGIYGTVFAESGLFYAVMAETFKNPKLKKFSGDHLTQLVGNGAPDYIIRDKHKLFVFEFKNVLFAAGPKHSYDFTQIRDEIFKKLVANQAGSPKGVTQLTNTIADIRAGRYDTIDDIPYSDLIIHPIVVTTDFLFNTHGINRIVEAEFKRLVEEKNIAENVNQVTLVDLDTLIKFQDLFIDHKLTLHHCLDDYRKYLMRGRDRVEKSFSFHKYMHDKTYRMKYDTPRLFLEMAKEIVAP